MQRYDWSEYDGMIPMEDGAFVLSEAAESALERAWLAAWDAEWRAQEAYASEEKLWARIGELK